MKNVQYDISVVIVNYNSSDYLSQCIDSIKKASNDLKVEIVVVDNNSTDRSIAGTDFEFDNLQCILLEKNIGFGSANNIGVSHSSGKYILILNPDTVIEEDTLNKMFQFMDDNPDIGVSGCKVLNSDGTFQLACRRGFPGPWASFSKLFGLQKLFPNSKLFAKYNMTYMPIDETYEVDSLIGAFMFVRREAWDSVDGFDEEFFMYGEDIDICYRIKKTGYKVVYFHQTSIIHYKGISTKRSTIDELGHFYDAMSIFSKKHFSYSFLFMILLKFGIYLRKIISQFIKYKKNILILIFDLIAINGSLLFATLFRFGGFFNFPEYAYPIVFIVLSLILVTTMTAVGEYFDKVFSVRRAALALLASFFILSSLTYFFKDFAFSRGVVLMTIGFTLLLSLTARIILIFYERIRGREKERLVAVLGINNESLKFAESFKKANLLRTKFIGFISSKSFVQDNIENASILGHYNYLRNIISEYFLNDIIIIDKELSSGEMISLIKENSSSGAKFHIAGKIDDYIASKIINDISGNEPGVPKISLISFKNKIIKRTFDLFFSILTLTIGFPFVYLLSNKSNGLIVKWFDVLKGRKTIVGLYPTKDGIYDYKTGLTGLAHISNPANLSDETIKQLNEYYILNYSFILDIEIFLKFIIRKKSGR